MTAQEDNTKLGKKVFQNHNEKIKPWSCMGQPCYRSLNVFLSHLFIILLNIFGCFSRIHFSKTGDENTVWVGFPCSAAGYTLPSPRQRKNYFLQKLASSYHWQVRPSWESHSVFCNWLKIGNF